MVKFCSGRHTQVRQDFLILHNMIQQLGAVQKLSHEEARTLCIRSRCASADQLLAFEDWTVARELSIMYKNKTAELRQDDEDGLCTFKSSKPQLEWMSQHSPDVIEKSMQSKPPL